MIYLFAIAAAFALVMNARRVLKPKHPPENGTWDSGRWNGEAPGDTWDSLAARHAEKES
jgi:hypothetical protein